MKQLFFIFILSSLCLSCTNKEKKGVSGKTSSATEVIKVDLTKEYKDKKFPNTNRSMHVQKLEDHKEFLIGYINKLMVVKDIIYILDSDKAKSLFLYSREGRFLNIINARGSGPGQYVRIDDFDVEKKSGNIVVLDASQRKFIFFSPEGTYIREIKIDFFAVNFILDDENNILADKGNYNSKQESNCIIKIDTNGKLLSNFFALDPSTKGIPLASRMPLQRCGSDIYYLPSFSNCIYALEGDSSNLVFQIDFGSDWPPKDFCEKMEYQHPLKIREELRKNNYVSFLNFIQTEEVLHLDFCKDEKVYSFYYNKQTKKSLLITLDDDDISLPLATDGNDFIFAKYREEGPPRIVFYTVNFDL